MCNRPDVARQNRAMERAVGLVLVLALLAAVGIVGLIVWIGRMFG